MIRRGICVSLQHGSNSLYQKFLNESSRSAPPPLADARQPAKKFSSQFLIFARHQKIFPRLRRGFGGQVKRKGNFSAQLCPQPFGQSGGSGVYPATAGLPARARRNSPHTPLPPRPRFGRRRNLYFASQNAPQEKEVLPLPQPTRARASLWNSLSVD